MSDRDFFALLEYQVCSLSRSLGQNPNQTYQQLLISLRYEFVPLNAVMNPPHTSLPRRRFAQGNPSGQVQSEAAAVEFAPNGTSNVHTEFRLVGQ